MRYTARSGAPSAEEECGSDGSTHASGSHDHPSLPDVCRQATAARYAAAGSVIEVVR
jgi:hypothetical protein